VLSIQSVVNWNSSTRSDDLVYELGPFSCEIKTNLSFRSTKACLLKSSPVVVNHPVADLMYPTLRVLSIFKDSALESEVLEFAISQLPRSYEHLMFVVGQTSNRTKGSFLHLI